MNTLRRWTASGTLLLAAAGLAVAQQDPPSRVARLKYVAGPVSFEPATMDQWTNATLNYPLTTGDKLYTDQGGRVDMRIGGNSIRLDSGTNFQFLNLNDQMVQISINSGNLDLNLRKLYSGETWEVDTPNGSITLSQGGHYRIGCDAARNTAMVTVRNGEADITSNQTGFQVYARQTAYFDGTNPPDIRDVNPPDAFDSFADSRDRMDDAPPPKYVSTDVEGYEDLNGNGQWQTASEYGPIWYPRVDAGWAPYHNGHWAWVEPWGWTWIDDASWGFAPFHYGRWANVEGRWGWCPGPRDAGRAVYAPALVAFVGGADFGLSLSIGGGGGAVGWFPLGPREQYYPSYRVSDAYVRNVNVTNTRITNITNITNVTNIQNVRYVNQNVPGAVVAVPQNSFASAQSVQRSAIRVQPGQMSQARIAVAPAVAPQQVSVLGRPAGAQVARPPAAIASRGVVARTAPPPPPVSFQARQSALQQNPGRPVAPSTLQTLRQQSPAPVGQTQVRTIAAPRTQIPNAQINRAPVGSPVGRPAAPAAAPSANRPFNPVAPQGAPPQGTSPMTRPAVPAPVPQTNRPGSSPAPQVARPPVETAPTRPYVTNPALSNPARQQNLPPRQAPTTVNPPQAPQSRPAPPQARPIPQEARPIPQESRPAPQVVRPAPQAEPRPQPVQPRPQAVQPRPETRPQAAPPRSQPAPRKEAEPKPKEEEKH